MTQHQVDQETRQCIQECTNCHQVCLQTIQHCLQMGGKHAEQAHVRLLADCAQICGVSADFMLRGSDLHSNTCEVCATVCHRCGEDCDRIGGGGGGGGDQQMKLCADTCRRCAASCRSMAQMAA